jgi:hypothetical protein
MIRIFCKYNTNKTPQKMFLHNGKNAYICHPKKWGISSSGQSVRRRREGRGSTEFFSSYFSGN